MEKYSKYSKIKEVNTISQSQTIFPFNVIMPKKSGNN